MKEGCLVERTPTPCIGYTLIPTPQDLSNFSISYIATVLQTKRVHFASWHKLVHNFKITSSVFKKR